MSSIPLLVKDDVKRLSTPAQIAPLGVSSMNQALTAVAQEIATLLKQPHSFQSGGINPAEATICGQPETVMIRAIEPGYRRSIAIEPLTARELEVLQLIVDGYNNPAIAEKLFITKETVKTHVRNVLKKLCVTDRTQAAIRALRSGLVH